MENQRSYESAGRWLSTVHRYGYMHLSKTFDEYGLGEGQVKFLMVLFEKKEQTQEQMANVLNIDKTTTARAVKKLEDEGYVTRKPHATDRRSHLVCLTAKALDMEPMIRSILKDWTNTLTEDFTDEEKVIVVGLLKRMATNAIAKIKQEEGVKEK
ncbi:MarR family winged helix-turn-helix transcriptional regulator [Jeotgalibacillus marinus]|uniref:MarR family transcriptional regulator n=1 Tax=Jeotgalibacillus marinus TaxID=86667 RepID=A0ABV3Q0S5_9BACL